MYVERMEQRKNVSTTQKDCKHMTIASKQGKIEQDKGD